MTAEFDFSSSMRDITKGLVVKSILQNYLFDARFPDFDLHFKNLGMQRDPDSWFHPSTHPTWSEGELYHYLAHPDSMQVEVKEYMGTLSVTIGSVMHEFIQMCLDDAGIMPRALQRCTVCPAAAQCKEPGVVDTEAGERGHMDGLLDLSRLSVPEQMEGAIWEFKTTNLQKLRKLADLDLAHYRQMWPDYYAQVQSYMRMHGARMAVVTFMAMGFPWEMKEVHVPYDPFFAYEVRDKYLRVREAVESFAPVPEAWCCRKPRACPARAVCKVRGHG